MKGTLIFVSVIVLLLLTAVVSLPYWLDVNDYKEEIADVIKEKTGLSVNIDGDISIRALPDLALDIDGISVLSVNEDGSNIFSSERLLVNIKFYPLFNKKLEIDSFILHSPVVNLLVDANGNSNWLNVEDSNSSISKVDINSESVSDISDFTSDRFYQKFLLSKFIIKDANIIYVDKTNNQHINIQGLNLDTSVKPGVNNISLSGKLDIFKNIEKGDVLLEGVYEFSGKDILVKDLVLKIDDIQVHSSLQVNFANVRPLVKLSLYTNNINLNNYLIDIENSKESNKIISDYKNESSTHSWSLDEIDVSFLNIMDVYFNFKTSGVTYNDINIGQTELYSQLIDKRLTVGLKESNLYSGKVKGDLSLELIDNLPNIKTKLDIDAIDFTKVPNNLKYVDISSGKLYGSMYLSSVGNSEKSVVSNLNGSGNINVKEGSFKGVDLVSMVNNITSSIMGNEVISTTRFEDVSATFDINNGVISNDNFVLKSDIINFAGSGDINLNNMTIDYKLLPKYSQDFDKSLEKNIPNVPIVITGGLSHPIFRLEVKSIVNELISNPKAGENLVNQLKKDFESIQGDFKNKTLMDLKNLFD